MIYSLTFTDDLPEGVGGKANFWSIKIRPEYKDDQGILEHEKEHVRQFWTFALISCILAGAVGFFQHLIWMSFPFCPLIHPFLLGVSKSYRQWAEIKAYKVQLKYSPDQLDWFAQRLTEMYGLDLTIEDAKKLLS